MAYLPVPKTFGTRTADIPLVDLDTNFGYLGRKFVDVRDFGALGVGGDDTAALAAAMAYATAGSLGLYASPGNYGTTAPLVVTCPFFFGAGRNTIISPLAAMTSVLSVTNPRGAVKDIFLQNLASRASRGLSFDYAGVSPDLCVTTFSGLVFDDFAFGFYNVANGGWTLRDCYFSQCGDNLWSTADARNTSITNNFMLGGSGMTFNAGAFQPEGTRISNNTLLPVANARKTRPYGIKFIGGLGCCIENNMVDQVVDTALVLDGTVGGINSFMVGNNWFGGNGAPAGINPPTMAVDFSGSVTSCHFNTNVFASFDSFGVRMTGVAVQNNTLFQNEFIVNNHTGSAGGSDLKIDGCLGTRIIGNNFASPNALQSINEVVNTSTSIVRDNRFVIGPTYTRSSASIWTNQIGLNPGWVNTGVTVTSSGGDFTDASGLMRFLKDGPTVNFQAVLSIVTNGGAASGAAIINVPAVLVPKAGKAYTVVGRNNTTGLALQGFISGTQLVIRNYDNSYPGADATDLYISGVYETDQL